mmetsp:Transcript_3792/g.10417  ORF Transcript_3792/g.10417 Transcript_3792/m.10417 type:complete len:279 (+) Transcript_3792:39-875(+)
MTTQSTVGPNSRHRTRTKKIPCKQQQQRRRDKTIAWNYDTPLCVKQNNKMSTPVLRFPLGGKVVPGDRLGSIRENLLPSNGTYEQGGHLYASVVGTLGVDDAVMKGKSKKVYYPVRVSPPERKPPRVLQVGHVILGRVTRLSIQQAFVEILACEGDFSNTVGTEHEANLLVPMGEGMIRREDVRTGATDQIKLQEFFRPNDLVLARIMSLGDRRYVLGTAEPSLGVIRAFSATSNALMIPISWREMECPVTGDKELRKCAKPPPKLMSQLISQQSEAG